MSAIFGVKTDDRDELQESIGRLKQALAHRGHHDLQVHTEQGIVLGQSFWDWEYIQSSKAHCAKELAEPPSSLTPLPKICVALHGRIDNCDELAAALGLAMTAPDVHDVRLLLAKAYRKWDIDFTAKIAGDFAIAIWDQAKRRLILVRDPMGVKPLFYAVHPNGRAAFASEAKSLARLRWVDGGIDLTKVGYYAADFFNDPRRTFFSGVHCLPAGHWIECSRPAASPESYWTFSPIAIPATQAGRIAEYKHLFISAVNDRIRSVAPSRISALLSGGLDSSAIACVAHQHLQRSEQQSLQCLSLTFPTLPSADERNYCTILENQAGLNIDFVRGDRHHPLEEISQLNQRLDAPVRAPNLFLHRALFRRSATFQRQIVLDGFDGDTVVCHGFSRPAELFHHAKLGEYLLELMEAYRSPTLSLGELLRGTVTRNIPLSLRKLLRRLRGKTDASGEFGTLVRSEFAKKINLKARVAQAPAQPLAVNNVFTEHLTRLKWGLFPSALEMLDQAAAIDQLEPRYPFFDIRLVDFCLSLPSADKYSLGWSRLIARQGMNDILPRQICWRPDKSDLSPCFQRNLLAYDRKYVEKTLHQGYNSLDTWIDLDLAKRSFSTLSRHQNNNAVVSFSENKLGMIVWKAVTLGSWLKDNRLAV